jgi:hypothetical protein
MVYFISGHRNFTQEEFELYYVPKLKKLVGDLSTKFVVGDYWGVDEMAQIWLKNNLPIDQHDRVTVYHMFKNPRVYCSNGFNLCGGFKTDVERDSAMTNISDEDIAFIHSGRWDSGTSQNVLRRIEVGKCKKFTNKYKALLNDTKRIYKENDLCMSEILASTSANGLSLEEAFDLYIELRGWSDSERNKKI